MMSALTSMVVCLVPRGVGRFEGGDAVQGWILSEVRRRNPRLAERLHANEGLKPYTVSPLNWVDGGRFGEVRLTALDESTASGIALSLRDAPADVGVGQTFWTVEKIVASRQQHHWAGATTAADLFRAAAGSHRRAVTFRFHSPTAFGGHGDSLSLFPDPRLVFRPLVERWRGLPFDGMPALPDQEWTRHIDVRSYELRTVTPPGAGRHVRAGFVGACTYQAERGAPAHIEIWLRACAALAFYSGVGMATARGMGQVETAWS